MSVSTASHPSRTKHEALLAALNRTNNFADTYQIPRESLQSLTKNVFDTLYSRHFTIFTPEQPKAALDFDSLVYLARTTARLTAVDLDVDPEYAEIAARTVADIVISNFHSFHEMIYIRL